MAGDATQFDELSEPDWGELEDLLANFARLAKSDAPFGRVAEQLADHLVTALAAVGAAIWLVEAPGSAQPHALKLEKQINLGALGDESLAGQHRQLLLAALDSGKPQVRGPDSGGGEANPTPYTLLLAPVVIDTDAVGLVEVIQRPTLSPDALDGSLRFTALLAELAADHLRRREVRKLRHSQRDTAQFEALLHAMHRELDPRATAAEIANEGRRLLGCDRLSVALRRGKKYRLTAVSSVDVIHRRSTVVRRLERLIARVAITGDPLWYDGDQRDLPPQIQQALNLYLDESHARSVGVIPLRGPARSAAHAAEEASIEGPLIGALVVEGFDGRREETAKESTQQIANHAGVALANAVRYRSLPTLPLLRSRYAPAGEPTYGRLKLLAAACLFAAVTSTFFIPADFNVYTQGELQPANRRHVFAPLDGQVAIVSVGHGDLVRQGQTLAELASPDLDLEIQKIQGEHDATLQRSRAIETALLDYGSSVDPEGMRVHQLSAEKQELEQLFASQKKRLAVLRTQRENLTVLSPLAGEVLTWETDRQLQGRPVRRGDRLMTVADITGPWEAELKIADEDVGPVLELLKRDEGKLSATFELATERGVEHSGEVTRIARRAEVGAENQSIVRATLQVDRASLRDPRPGATVFATINCGQRSLFYIWCHDLIEHAQGWLRF